MLEKKHNRTVPYRFVSKWMEPELDGTTTKKKTLEIKKIVNPMIFI